MSELTSVYFSGHNMIVIPIGFTMEPKLSNSHDNISLIGTYGFLIAHEFMHAVINTFKMFGLHEKCLEPMYKDVNGLLGSKEENMADIFALQIGITYITKQKEIELSKNPENFKVQIQKYLLTVAQFMNDENKWKGDSTTKGKLSAKQRIKNDIADQNINQLMHDCL